MHIKNTIFKILIQINLNIYKLSTSYCIKSQIKNKVTESLIQIMEINVNF